MKTWFTWSCVLGTVILACILPALAVLSFVCVAAYLIARKD